MAASLYGVVVPLSDVPMVAGHSIAGVAVLWLAFRRSEQSAARAVNLTRIGAVLVDIGDFTGIFVDGHPPTLYVLAAVCATTGGLVYAAGGGKIIHLLQRPDGPSRQAGTFPLPMSA